MYLQGIGTPVDVERGLAVLRDGRSDGGFKLHCRRLND